MITVISPAKKLSEECSAAEFSYSQSDHLKKTTELANQLKNFEPSHLQDLMSISEKLSILNWERYQNWQLPFTANNSRQAFFTFKGGYIYWTRC
jgi:Uncharacterized protein conserved in bacteria